MKSTTLLCAALLLAGTLVSRAEVVVYQAVTRNTGDVTQAAVPSVYRSFVVIDYDAKLISSVSYFPQSKSYSVGNAGPIHITTAPITNGRSVSVIATASTNDTSATQYGDSLVFQKGTNVTLRLANKPLNTARNLPLTLTGFADYAGFSNGSALFHVTTYSLTFNAAKTLEANNAQRSAQEALDAIGAEFKAKGYTKS